MSSDESVGTVELDSRILVVDNILFCLYLYFYASRVANCIRVIATSPMRFC
jgi:hypothetical protein